ncbi:hypothetical protein AOC36_09150 [Erysipelothrix larvae]|uniref:Uncharacterized protein n=1 Tax=Erysipelothrix larvae TaxID=1514105 RepID=A0A0X8H147_9FIRM|nr:hypothetical protein [Erysipelothrix larvae]AMC94148.1 hypothetical protein AOC36_09150 [Erysipelothrix larvae]
MTQFKSKKRVFITLCLLIVLGIGMFSVDSNRIHKGKAPIFSIKVSEYTYIGLGTKIKYVPGGYATMLLLWGDFESAGEPSNHATIFYIGYK